MSVFPDSRESGTLVGVDERRRAPRFEILDRVHGQIVSLAAAVRVREISLGGLSFESAIAFPVGAIHEFRMQLGDRSDVVLRGRVVRCLQHGMVDGSLRYTTAIQFVDDEPPPDDEPSIADLIQRIA
jgi:PilZ domain-containing protein